jgi:hypothetical protein
LLLLLPQALSARDATITAVMPNAPMLLVRHRGLKACNVSLLQWNDYDLPGGPGGRCARHPAAAATPDTTST